MKRDFEKRNRRTAIFLVGLVALFSIGFCIKTWLGQ